MVPFNENMVEAKYFIKKSRMGEVVTFPKRDTFRVWILVADYSLFDTSNFGGEGNLQSFKWGLC